jgi:hypothetical protein
MVAIDSLLPIRSSFSVEFAGFGGRRSLIEALIFLYETNGVDAAEAMPLNNDNDKDLRLVLSDDSLFPLIAR